MAKVVCEFCGCEYREKDAIEVYVGSELLKVCPCCGQTEMKRVMVQ